MATEQDATGWAMIHKLQADLTALQGRMAQLQGEGQRTESSTSNAWLAKKAVPPPRFVGHQNKLRPILWLRKCEAFFEQCHAQHAPGKELVNFAVSLLDGPANAWWESLCIEPVREGTGAPDFRTDWEQFKLMFVKYFTVPGQEEADRDRLDTCRQRYDVATYNTEFMYLTLLVTDWSESARVHKYICGLRSPMQELVKLSRPATLSDAMRQALEVESTRQRPRHDYPMHSRYPPTSKPNMGVAPMELGNLNMEEDDMFAEPQEVQATRSVREGNSEDNPRLHAMQRRRQPPKPCPICKGAHWKSDCPRLPHQSRHVLTCFNCHQPGHKRAECPLLRPN